MSAGNAGTRRCVNGSSAYGNSGGIDTDGGRLCGACAGRGDKALGGMEMEREFLEEIEKTRPTEFAKKYERLLSVGALLGGISDADARKLGGTFDFAANCMTVAQATQIRARLEYERALLFGEAV